MRFYKSFQICSTLTRLEGADRARKAGLRPLGDSRAGIANRDGAITLGDSHEYGLDVDIFDKPEIDELILEEARTFLELPDWRIAQRWHGVYSLHPEKPFFEAEPAPGVRIVTAPGGSGMTLSFGLAERTAQVDSRLYRNCVRALHLNDSSPDETHRRHPGLGGHDCRSRQSRPGCRAMQKLLPPRAFPSRRRKRDCPWASRKGRTSRAFSISLRFAIDGPRFAGRPPNHVTVMKCTPDLCPGRSRYCRITPS